MAYCKRYGLYLHIELIIYCVNVICVPNVIDSLADCYSTNVPGLPEEVSVYRLFRRERVTMMLPTSLLTFVGKFVVLELCNGGNERERELL